MACRGTALLFLLINIYTISIAFFSFFWRYILVSLLRSIPALLDFHLEHCAYLTDVKLTADLLILSRNQTRLVVGLLTGHSHLRKHQHRPGIYKEEPVCRKCGMGEETALHTLFECESLGRIRYSVLGPPGFELETIHQEPIKPLLDLIRKAGIFDGIYALPRGA
jgi:hypothetical protein